MHNIVSAKYYIYQFWTRFYNPGFFHKIFLWGEGNLLSGTIFQSPSVTKLYGGDLTSGTESDEGDFKNLSVEAKHALLQQN